MWNLSVEIWRSLDDRISTMEFPILVRWHTYIELTSWRIVWQIIIQFGIRMYPVTDSCKTVGQSQRSHYSSRSKSQNGNNSWHIHLLIYLSISPLVLKIPLHYITRHIFGPRMIKAKANGSWNMKLCTIILLPMVIYIYISFRTILFRNIVTF